MAITEVRWDEVANDRGADIHVVGVGVLSRQLRPDLWVRDAAGYFQLTPANAVRLANNHADVFFDAQFTGAPTAHNVKVDRTTGEVEIQAGYGTATSVLRNFIIHVNVIHTDGSPSPPPIAIRVHLHLRIEDYWLTPDALEVHLGAAIGGFTILARFDDQVIGNLTWHRGVLWSTPPAGPVVVDPITGRLGATAPAGISPVRALVPGTVGLPIPSADAICLPPWSAGPRRAKLVGTPGGNPNNVRNVLILSDGFLAADEPHFNAAVLAVVNRQRITPQMFPWNHVSKKINFWSLFVPSRQTGSSIRNALRLQPPPPPVGPIGPTVGIAIAEARRGAGPINMADLDGGLEELVYRVGLPIPADLAGIEAPVYVTKIADWVTLYGFAEAVPINMFREWRNLAGYILPDERDTGLGLSFGNPMRGERYSPPRILVRHTRRTERAHIDQILSTVVDDATGNPIGVPPGPPPGPLPPSPWLGNDRSLVFVIAAGPRWGGARGELVTTSVHTEPEAPLTHLGGNHWRPDQRPYLNAAQLAALPIDTWATFAHETAHVFRLGDEYGEAPTIPAGVIPELARYGNLAAKQPPLTGAGGTVFPDEAKWHWPRIKRAAVLTDVPRLVGATIELKVKAGHTAGFANGQIIRLRSQDLLPPAPPAVAVPPVPMYRSDRLRVKNVFAASRRIIAEWVAGAPPLPGAVNLFEFYPAGSLVIEPVRDPVTGNDLHLISPAVAGFMFVSGYPLDTMPADPSGTCNPATLSVWPMAVAQPAHRLSAFLPLLSQSPAHSHHIIGLYNGGRRYHCGVLHPAGACLMRQLEGHDVALPVPAFAFRFCQVCRYLLVDQIRPRLHGLVNKLYDKEYPKL
jgi:hypothetical protein